MNLQIEFLVIVELGIYVNTLFGRHFSHHLLQSDRKQHADSICLSSPVVPDVLEEVEGLL